MSKAMRTAGGWLLPERAYLARVMFLFVLFTPPLFVLVAEPEQLTSTDGWGSIAAIWGYSIVIAFALHWSTAVAHRVGLQKRSHEALRAAEIAVSSAVVVAALTFALFPAMSLLCPHVWGEEISILVRGLVVGLSYVAIGRLLRVFQLRAQLRLVEDEKRKAALADARFKSLQAQMHPHFLFNALNAIAEQVHSEPEKAEQSLEDLSELLRSHLRHASAQLVAVHEEIDHAERYLSLQRVRFGARFRYVLRATRETLSLQLPSLMLQPLLENAVKHGVAQRVDPTQVIVTINLVRGASEKRVLEISVKNEFDIPRNAPKGTGFGLRATRERIAALFPIQDETYVDVSSANGWFEVLIRLPARVAIECNHSESQTPQHKVTLGRKVALS